VLLMKNVVQNMTQRRSPLKNDMVERDFNMCRPDCHVATPDQIYYDCVKNDR